MRLNQYLLPIASVILATSLAGCSSSKVSAGGAQRSPGAVTVGVTPVVRRTIARDLTVSTPSPVLLRSRRLTTRAGGIWRPRRNWRHPGPRFNPPRAN